MGTPLAIGHLGAIASHLRDADHQLAGWLTEVVASIRLGMSLEAAFGLAHGYDAHCRQQAQDAALTALVAASPDRRSINVLAHRLAREIAAYEGTAWIRDQEDRGRPDGEAGHIFDYLSAKGPTSAQRLRKLLPHLVTKSSVLTNSLQA